ncbi:MAG: potassium-transporting ATPase subunit KdpA [Candidatus Sphingomonas colombiensis]|nr:potassium-transporting ATPase subunit KdpA [Sphingomonas sp.]WEK43355.1 MAG: potassium-transporting ATPase subunit KdpA [Sphingomonas sp.]
MAARAPCPTSARCSALTIHNFLSAATGIAIAFALFRGFARRDARRSAISGPI